MVQTQVMYVFFNMILIVSWSQLGSDIDGEAAGDSSGRSVSLSSDGTIVAIGAIYNSGGGNGSNSGHVRVFQYDSNTTSWSQLGSDIDGEAAGDYSGFSVNLSSDGTIVAIGATYNDGNGSNSGHVRVFQYSNSSWSQLGNDIDGEAAGDYSGYSVSLSSMVPLLLLVLMGMTIMVQTQVMYVFINIVIVHGLK